MSVLESVGQSMGMKYNTLLVLIIFLTWRNNTDAQEFSTNGRELSDFMGQEKADSFPILVRNLPLNTSNSFGLEKACITLTHARVSDLKISLVAPDGTTIWLTNRNGGDEGRNYIGTCFKTRSFNGPISEGKGAFESEYTPDGRMSFFNNGLNPNGIWYITIADLKTGEIGHMLTGALYFSNVPSIDNITTPCSDSNPTACIEKNPSVTKGQLLPDLVVLPNVSKKQWQYFDENHPDNKLEFKLAISIANIGDGPMEIYGDGTWLCGSTPAKDKYTACPDGSYPRQGVFQKIYYKDGSNKLASKSIHTGTLYYDSQPGHNHFHVDDWATFKILKPKKIFFGLIKYNKEIARSNKVSYCLWDTGICTSEYKVCEIDNILYNSQTLPNYGLGLYTACNESRQGISVGGYDTYGAFFEGQTIKLEKNLTKGQYIVEIQIDPSNKYQDLNKSNNQYNFSIQI
jgi:hypothetical protein